VLLAATKARSQNMVRAVGLEPTRRCHRGILSPLRLPVPPRPPLLISIAFSPPSIKWFASHSSMFCKRGSLFVLQPAESRDDVGLTLYIPSVMGAHALRLVPEQVGELRIVGAVALPPGGVGGAQTVQRGSQADDFNSALDRAAEFSSSLPRRPQRSLHATTFSRSRETRRRKAFKAFAGVAAWPCRLLRLQRAF
jgi:hypothetical protein